MAHPKSVVNTNQCLAKLQSSIKVILLLKVTSSINCTIEQTSIFLVACCPEYKNSGVLYKSQVTIILLVACCPESENSGVLTNHKSTEMIYLTAHVNVINILQGRG